MKRFIKAREERSDKVVEITFSYSTGLSSTVWSSQKYYLYGKACKSNFFEA